MTEQELINAVLSGDSNYLLSRASVMSEEDKAVYADVSLKLSKEVRRLANYAEVHEEAETQQRVTEWLTKKSKNTTCEYITNLFALHCASDVAMVSFCQAEDMPRELFWGIWGNEKLRERLIIQAMSQRSTDWKRRYFSNKNLNAYYGLFWEEFWAIMNEGASERPLDARYYGFFIDRFSSISLHSEGDISGKIRLYPEFLESDIWGVFKVNSRALVLRDKYEADERGTIPKQERWYEAIYKLEKEGLISRARLLDECLIGMSLPLSSVVLSNMLIFYQGLNPSDAEVASRGHLFVDILIHGKGKVFAFAIAQLQALSKRGDLNTAYFIANATTILKKCALGQAKSTLKLIKLLLAHDPTLKQSVSALLATVLEEMHGDLALLLTKAQAEFSPAPLDNKREGVYQSNTGEKDKTDAYGMRSVTSTDCVSLDKTTDTCRRLSKLDAESLKRAGLNFSLASDGKCLVGLCAPVTDISMDRVLTADTQLTVATGMRNIATLIDAEGSYDYFGSLGFRKEIIMDGLMRLYNQPSESNVVSLQEKSVEKNLTAFMSSYKSGYINMNRFKHRFEHRLTYEQCQFVLNGGCAPALSLPSHVSGWLSPVVLVKRFNIWLDNNLEIIRPDFILALLRLAPDFRSQALALLKPSQDFYRRVISWALGGEASIAANNDEETLVWLAAARARQPYGELIELAALDVADYGPNFPRPANMQWRTTTRHVDTSKHIYESSLLVEFGYQDDRQVLDYYSFPGGYLYTWQPRTDVGFMLSETELLYAHSYSMLNDDGYWAMVIKQLCYCMDVSAKFHIDNVVLLNPLTFPDKQIRELMVIAVFIALMAKREEFRVKGISIVKQLIAEERFDERLWATVASKLLLSPWAKLNRLVPSFKEIADTSSLHCLRVAQCLQALFNAMASLPKAGHFLLSLAVAINESIGYVYQPSTITHLKTLKASGKSATLVKHLQAAPSADDELHHRVLLQRINIRLAKAEKYTLQGYT